MRNKFDFSVMLNPTVDPDEHELFKLRDILAKHIAMSPLERRGLRARTRLMLAISEFQREYINRGRRDPAPVKEGKRK